MIMIYGSLSLHHPASAYSMVMVEMHNAQCQQTSQSDRGFGLDRIELSAASLTFSGAFLLFLMWRSPLKLKYSFYDTNKPSRTEEDTF